MSKKAEIGFATVKHKEHLFFVRVVNDKIDTITVSDSTLTMPRNWFSDEFLAELQKRVDLNRSAP
jgi:hypothetical protein